MQFSPKPTSQPSVATSLYALLTQAQHLATCLSDVEEQCDALAWNVLGLYDAMKDNREVLGRGAPQALRSLRRRVRAMEERERIWARSGVAAVKIVRRAADGSASVWVEGCPAKFDLAPTLAALLEILITDPGTSDDALIGWRSRDEVARMLGARLGKTVGQHSLTQDLARLTDALTAANVNPFLIQREDVRGLRFALRRSACPAVGAPE